MTPHIPDWTDTAFSWAIASAVAALLFVVFCLAGCVRSVTVCTTYDRRLGTETPDRYARDNAGASVCADLTPPRLVRPALDDEGE